MTAKKSEYVKLSRIKTRATQLGVVLLVVSCVFFVKEYRYINRAPKVTASVSWVELDEMRAPVLEYTSLDGEFKSIIAQESNLFYDYREGMQTDIRYDPDHPEDVKFDHFFVLWAGTGFFALLALACLAFAYLMGIFIKHYRSEQPRSGTA